MKRLLQDSQTLWAGLWQTSTPQGRWQCTLTDRCCSSGRMRLWDKSFLLTKQRVGLFACLFAFVFVFSFVYFPIRYFLQLWSTLQWTDTTQISSHGLLHKNSCHAAQATSSSASGTGTVRYTWLPNAQYCSRLRLCVEPFPWQQEQRHTPKVFAQQMRKASLTTNNYTTC